MRNKILQSAASFGIGFVISASIFRDIPKTLTASFLTAFTSNILEFSINKKSKSEIELLAQSSVQEDGASSVAVYWDFENISFSTRGTVEAFIQYIDDYAANKGHLQIKKVYANWRRVPRQIAQRLSGLGFEQVQVSMEKQNSADVKLAVDCLSAAHQIANLDHFILVSADKDFISLIHNLKALKKKVTVVAYSNTVSQELKAGADVFVSLDEIKAAQPKPNPNSLPKADAPTLSYDQAIAYLKDAIALVQQQGKSVVPSRLAELMQQNSKGHFRQARHIQTEQGKKFKTFSDFLDSAAAEVNLDLVSFGRTPLASATSEFQPPITTGLPYPDAIIFLQQAILLAQQTQRTPTISAIAQRMQQVSEGRYRGSHSILRNDGTKFKQFNQFLAAAETDGQIKANRNEDSTEPYFTLPDASDQDRPSLNVPGAVEAITPAEWRLILNRLDVVFKETAPLPVTAESTPPSLKFMSLLYHMRQLKKEGILLQPGRLLHLSLEHLIQVGLLVKQADGGFWKTETWPKAVVTFLQQVDSQTPEPNL